MPASRVPQEPADISCLLDDGFKILKTLDFSSIGYEKGSVQYNRVVREYMDTVQEQCRVLSDGTVGWENTGDVTCEDTVCEKLKVAGTNIPLVRHSAVLDIPAEILFSVFHAVSYCSLIDPYAFHVEAKDTFETEKYDWANIVWTVDSILPLFAARDFCTLDFVDSKGMMICSKSVEHPLIPRTKLPSKSCMFKKKTIMSRTYRVPLLWSAKVVPIDSNSCRLIQLHWSDIGGIIPEDRIMESLVKFGFDSFRKLCRLSSDVVKRNLEVPNFESILLKKWNKNANNVIPGVDKTY